MALPTCGLLIGSRKLKLKVNKVNKIWTSPRPHIYKVEGTSLFLIDLNDLWKAWFNGHLTSSECCYPTDEYKHFEHYINQDLNSDGFKSRKVYVNCALRGASNKFIKIIYNLLEYLRSSSSSRYIVLHNWECYWIQTLNGKHI